MAVATVATVAARLVLWVLRDSGSGPAIPPPRPPTLSSPHVPDLWVQGQQEIDKFLEQEEGIEAAKHDHEAPDGLRAVAVRSPLAVVVQPQNLGGAGGAGLGASGSPPSR